VSERVETGPVQFGDDDWPGVFIRGDNALAAAIYLEEAVELYARARGPIMAAVLRGLLDTLRSCDVRAAEGSVPIADMRRRA